MGSIITLGVAEAAVATAVLERKNLLLSIVLCVVSFFWKSEVRLVGFNRSGFTLKLNLSWMDVRVLEMVCTNSELLTMSYNQFC